MKNRADAMVSANYSNGDSSDVAKAIDKQTAMLTAQINSLHEDLKQALEIYSKQVYYTYRIRVLLQKVIEIMRR